MAVGMRTRTNTRAWACALLLGAGLAPPAWGQSLAGAQPAARLVARDALVYDRKTDLTWQRCAVGQRWLPGQGGLPTCTGQPVRLTFDAAKRLEAKGWRIPTLDELVTLLVKDAQPRIDAQAFPATPATYFWATDNRDKASAWYVSFDDGRTNHYFPPRTNADVVRFVRSGVWSADAGPQVVQR